MKQKSKNWRGALKRACFALFGIAFLLGAMLGTNGCSGEDFKPYSVSTDTVTIIKDLYWQSERIGLSSVNVKDTLVKSDVDFKVTSSLFNEKENVRLTFHPSAYLNVRLSKPRIEVRSKAELPVTLTKAFIQSQKPYKSGTTFGADVVKVFEYSDGQVAHVSYGYRYMGVVNGNDTLAVPHVEISDVTYDGSSYEADGAQTNTEDPYRMTLRFKGAYAIKGTTAAELSNEVLMRPWYRKVITSEAEKVLDVSYSGQFVGCPVEAYELKEMVKTNKGEFSNTYKVALALAIHAPQRREQPTLDSLFNVESVGKLSETVFSEIKNDDGFTVRTMNGTYVSTNTGRENRTNVESVLSFTYQTPVKFQSQYGSYAITPLELNFEEIGFNVKKVSDDKNGKVFLSTNMVEGVLGTCRLDIIDELVDLKMQKEVPPSVTKVDSTYVLKGDGDDYIVDKTIIWSDGSKTTTTYSYKGRHEAKAVDFGNKVTSSLNWNEEALKRVSQSSKNEEKRFSDVTKFSVVYTTSRWQALASNQVESGQFSFVETVPKVTFIDGNTTKVFDERKYVLNGLGADVASDFTPMVVGAKSYKAYAYDYVTRVVFDGTPEADLTSLGYLLIEDEKEEDVTGEPRYEPSQTWNGNTTTVRVKKTTPHSLKDDEVEVYQKTFTIMLSGLTDGKLYADDTNFKAQQSHQESKSLATDGFWQVNSSEHRYQYVVSNGIVNRSDLQATAKDAEITFDDGKFRHVFNVRLTVSFAEKFGTSRSEGEYTVTPHILTVSGRTVDSKSLSTIGQTDIYVKNKGDEPEPPHLGKPKGFTVTATFDPSAKVTRRAFVFNWEDGVTYAVCDYETMLPEQSAFSFKKDTYSGYNSVGYNVNNASSFWQPARGVDDAAAISWYAADGSRISAIDKALSCKVIGWKNIVNGDYALVIEGYRYEINGYTITVIAPNGESVSFNSHYQP